MKSLLAIALVVAGAAVGQGEVAWRGSLPEALQEAAANRKLVLVHFSAAWCAPCKRLEAAVYELPQVGPTIEVGYVPVRLDFDEHREMAASLGVTQIPTDVVMDASGTPLRTLACSQQPGPYLDRLIGVHREIAAAPPQADAALVARAPGNPAAPPPAAMSPPASPTQDFAAAPPAQAVASGPAPQAQNPFDAIPSSVSVAQKQLAPRQQQTPPPAAEAAVASAASPTTQLPAGSPELALDGYCPVELVRNTRWVKGDPRWGAVHEGRTYLFAGPEQQAEFLAGPTPYAPVLGGLDPVMALDFNSVADGARRYGAEFAGRIFLFGSERTLDRFRADPTRYSPHALVEWQAARQAGNPVR